MGFDLFNPDGKLSDAELRSKVGTKDDSGKLEIILNYRSTMREAKGNFEANAIAAVHVDSLQAKVEYWCDVLRQEAENEKAKQVKEAAKAISDHMKAFPEWEKVDPTVAILPRSSAEPPADEERIRQGIYKSKSLYADYLYKRDSPAGNLLPDAKKKILYQRCMAALAKYRSCENDYLNAKDKTEVSTDIMSGVVLGENVIPKESYQKDATNCAQKALDEYANNDNNTDIGNADVALYYGKDALDGLSYVPLVGTGSSIVLAGLYAATGDLSGAAIAGAGAVPAERLLAAGGKLGAKAVKAIDRVLPTFRGTAEEQIARLARMDPDVAARKIDDLVAKEKMPKEFGDALKAKAAAKREELGKLEANVVNPKGKAKEKADLCAC